ncbi:MAG: peptidase [Ilumatobacteraceae bacterium]|nr:peptidase [Ilumatobacteraceae bacterium]
MTTTEPVLDGADPGIRPQDDLFGHVNGAWLATAEIPADLAVSGGFIDLALEAEEIVGEIVGEARDAVVSGEAGLSDDRRKLGDLYASFLDVEHVDELGAEPIAADLAAIAAVADTSELVRLIGRFQREGAGGLVDAYVNTDDRRSDRNIVNLVQGGIGLPDESFYREDGFTEIRDAYVAHVARILQLTGQDEVEAADAAARILALETRLASGHWDRVRSRDVIASYNLTSFAELADLAPAYDWAAWTDGLGATGDELAEVLVRQPSFFGVLSDALAEVPLADWKAWLAFHTAVAAAPYLSAPFVDEHFAFSSQTLKGVTEQRDRWKRGVGLCNSLLGEAIGKIYVARTFPPEAKAQMDELVANLVAAYRVSISRLPWMSEETRERALAKLELFRPKIGYPDVWRDYSALVIERDDLLGNVRRGAAFETARQLAKIGAPVDRDEWLMTPQTVNAYYNPGVNEICFPAAILQPPFFDPEADPALNYGGIGAVIGHEVGHGFDDQGSQYDGEGNLDNWWTDADREQFQVLADQLIAQYDGFEPRELPGHHVNGALTVGENIGDLGGLTIGLLAYELSLGDAGAPVIDGTTGRSRVFRNWAEIWRIKTRKEAQLQLLSLDPHSPAEFRANIVRNLDEFHEEFATTPDDGLWLEPSERVRIW